MTNDDGLGVEEILEKLQDTDNLPGEIHGTRLKTEEYAGGVKKTRLEIWEVLPHSVRTELLTEETVREFDFELDVAFAPTSKLGNGGDVMLRNRDGFVVYDSETNRYHRYDFEPPEDAGGYATDSTLVGSSPEANFDVTDNGTATVAGRETHVLTFRPSEDADKFYRAFDYVTLWIDGEYWFPLKHEAEYDLGGGGLLQPDTDEDRQDETYFQTETFEEIAFNTGIEDSRFRPPDDARRVA